MVQSIIKMLVNSIIDVIKKLLFQYEVKKQKEVINEAVKIAEESKAKSDVSYDDFKSEYEQYKRDRDQK